MTTTHSAPYITAYAREHGMTLTQAMRHLSGGFDLTIMVFDNDDSDTGIWHRASGGVGTHYADEMSSPDAGAFVADTGDTFRFEIEAVAR